MKPEKPRTRLATFVDPPTGWKYGFPCELKDGVTFEELLKAHKYPEQDFELAKTYSRWWTEEIIISEKAKKKND